jgi:hypothetical protein
VKARGKKASRTFFPRRADSVTSEPEVEGSVKSGAGEPMGGRAMVSRERNEMRRVRSEK